MQQNVSSQLLSKSFFRVIGRMSYRSLLISVFGSLIVISIFLTGYMAYRNGKDAVRSVIHQLRQEISLRVKEHLESYMAVQHRINHNNALAYSLGYLNIDDFDGLRRQFQSQIAASPFTAYIYHSDEVGRFCGVMRGPDGTLLYALKETSDEVNQYYRIFNLDDSGRVGNMTHESSVEMRSRPWYVAPLKSGAEIWGDIFAQYDVVRINIPLSLPIYNQKKQFQGVFGINVDVTPLSDYLKSFKVGKSGGVFILERDGTLVASSFMKKPFVLDKTGRTIEDKPKRVLAVDAEHHVTRQSTKFLVNTYGRLDQIQQSRQLEVSIEGTTQYLQVLPFKDGVGLDWLIVVTIPESDFSEQIDAGFRNTLFTILLATAIGILFSFLSARWISKPIQQLSHWAHLISKGETVTVDMPHREDEVGKLASSFDKMAREIQLRTAELEESYTALKSSEAQFRSFSEQSLVGIYMLQGDTFIYVNPRFAEIFGYTAEECLANLSFRELVHPDEIVRVEEQIHKRVAGKTSYVNYNFRGLKKNGDIIHVEVYGSTIIYEGNPLISGTILDFTERKLVEKALAEEKELLDVTLRYIGDGVITTDINGRVILINKVAEKLTGRSQSEAAGKDINDVFNMINATTRQKCEDPVERVLKAKNIIEQAGQTNLVSRDGTERIIADSGAPIFDTNSEVIGVVIVFRDVTEKHKIEIQLQQAQKMEAVGTLAGGIAHDFNNMLGVITGNISFALSNLNKNDELYEVLSDVQESSKQAQNLTLQLLTFSKGGAPIKKISDINSLIKDSAIFAARGAMTNCNFKLSPDLWLAEVDQGQINQVIGNLVINANQAMPNGGTLTIRTENTKIGAESGLPLPAGQYIKVIVEDQGVGIPKQYLANIFEPYFTTKQKGSGLGLATTYSIVKRHGGHITVYSEIEKGTCFNIYLPTSTKDAGKVEGKQESKHTGQGKILIMDDQEIILKMIGRLLSRMGYTTTLATDGVEAIKFYREAYQSQAPFDIVILDLTVPGGMGGVKTIEELLKIAPNVKAFVSSGYSNDPIMANYEDYGFCGVIPKPYTKAELAEALNKIFDEKD